MVAGPHHYCHVITWRLTHFRRQLRRCSLYLFLVLMKWKAKHSSLLVIALGFGVFFLLFRKDWMLLPVGISAIGFVIGPVGEYIHVGWMLLAKVLGYINSRILLSIVFFLVLTPIALLMRLLGKTQFVKKRGNQQSLFVTRNHLYNRQDLEQPF